MPLKLPISAVLPALLPLALLAACGDKSAPEESNGAASGKVLDGTISDGMIPLDDLTSQPPLRAPEPTEGAAAPAGESTDATSETDSAETAPEAAAATPSASPSAAQP